MKSVNGFYDRRLLGNFLQEQSPGGALLKSVFKNFAKFTEKNLCNESLFDKAAEGLRRSGDCFSSHFSWKSGA